MVYNAINCPQIHELNEDDGLVVVLTMWRNYIGVKEQLTLQEIEMNTNHIKSNYPDFTLEMINLAIKYSLTGKLDVDVKPYGTFSPLYISTILNQYREYSNNIKSKINDKLKREKQMLEMNPTYTTEQKINNRLQYLNYYRDNVANESLRDFKGIMWELLTRYNLLSEIKSDKELIKRESIKKRNQFIDLSIDDILELEKYSILKQFFELNPDFDFTKLDLLYEQNKPN
jgi:hypothetical protein